MRYNMCTYVYIMEHIFSVKPTIYIHDRFLLYVFICHPFPIFRKFLSREIVFPIEQRSGRVGLSITGDFSYTTSYKAYSFNFSVPIIGFS